MDTHDSGRGEKSRRAHCEHLPLFGKPPLFEGEEETYNELLTKVSSVLMPGDVFEEILAGEYVYLSIDVIRLRRTEVNLIKSNEHRGMTEALAPIMGRSDAELS